MRACESTSHPPVGGLSQWLRLLWDVAPNLHFDSEDPFIAGSEIHLPRQCQMREASAAAAHAAAHLVYSPPRFDGRGLGPIARALVALLEDARVEALAMRELPGLGRFWRPLHVASPGIGDDCESLLARLARALADPGYQDPNAWVRKGKALFYLDAKLGLLALRTAAEVVHAATLLGNDIGQMRLRLNDRGYRPQPAYRDDHRWMWSAQPVAENVAPSPAPTPTPHPGERLAAGPSSFGGAPRLATRLYPEWDRLISRTRPDWVRVVEHTEACTDISAPPTGPGPASTSVRSLRAALRNAKRPRHRRLLAESGDSLDLPAMIDWRTSLAAGSFTGGRFYRELDRQARHSSVMVLIDQSASAAEASAPGTPSALRIAAHAAASIAVACESMRMCCCVSAFESRGRREVNVRLVKNFGEPADTAFEARLVALRPQGSTRLGAALRHAVRRLSERPVGSRWLLVISDGRAHDIDVHDPAYLAADARHAVRSAQRVGVEVRCLAVGVYGTGIPGRQVFGIRHFKPLPGLGQLARAVRQVVA